MCPPITQLLFVLLSLPTEKQLAEDSKPFVVDSELQVPEGMDVVS